MTINIGLGLSKLRNHTGGPGGLLPGLGLGKLRYLKDLFEHVLDEFHKIYSEEMMDVKKFS